MSDLQRDIEQIEWVMSGRTDDEPWAAWQRIRASLEQAPPAAVPAGYVPVSALIEAREEVESWAAYATPYFQDKHNLAEVLAKIDGQIAAAQAQQPAAAVPEGYALVPVADLESLAFTDFGRAFWTDGAEAAALRIRAMLAAERKGVES